VTVDQYNILMLSIKIVKHLSISMKKDLKGRIEITKSGKPIIKGTKVPVYSVLDILSDGGGFEEVLKKYPNLEKEDVRAAIKFASLVLGNEEDNLYGA